MARFDLSDTEWSIIAPLLPNKSRGVSQVDDRRVLNGIFWVLRAGATCRSAYRPSRRSTTASSARRSRRVGAPV